MNSLGSERELPSYQEHVVPSGSSTHHNAACIVVTTAIAGRVEYLMMVGTDLSEVTSASRKWLNTLGKNWCHQIHNRMSEKQSLAAPNYLEKRVFYR